MRLRLLIYGSHLLEDIKDGQGYGWALPDGHSQPYLPDFRARGVNPSLDWDKLIEAKNAEVFGLHRWA